MTKKFGTAHALVIHRDLSLLWLLDSNRLGACCIDETYALRLINRSDETFLVERR